MIYVSFVTLFLIIFFFISGDEMIYDLHWIAVIIVSLLLVFTFAIDKKS
jgi:hypothetical protein